MIDLLLDLLYVHEKGVVGVLDVMAYRILVRLSEHVGGLEVVVRMPKVLAMFIHQACGLKR